MCNGGWIQRIGYYLRDAVRQDSMGFHGIEGFVKTLLAIALDYPSWRR